jgi:hypothetical protein
MKRKLERKSLKHEETGTSANVKASHEFLARFHREIRAHSSEHLLAAFRVHRGKFAHQFVACFPFRVFAPANANGEKRGDGPNGNVCRGHERNKEAKSINDKPTENGPSFL